MAEVDLALPKFGMNMTEAEVVEWLVSEGDSVTKGDDMCEVSTDKADSALESPATGVVSKILVPVGGTPAPGDVLATITTS